MSFDTEKFISEVEKRPQLYDCNAEAYRSRAVTRMCWSEVGEIMFPDEWSTLSPPAKRTRIKLLIKKWKSLRDNFVREYKVNLCLVKKTKEVRKKKKTSFYNELQFLQPYIGGQAAAARMENVVSCDLEFPGDSETGFDDSDPLVVPHDDSLYDDPTILQEDINDSDDVKPDIEAVRFDQSESLSSVNEEELPLPIRNLSKRSDSIALALKSKKTTIRRYARASASVRASASKSAEAEDDVYGHRAFMMSYIPILNNMPLHVAMQARMQISQVMSSSFMENSSQATPTSILTENSDLN